MIKPYLNKKSQWEFHVVDDEKPKGFDTVVQYFLDHETAKVRKSAHGATSRFAELIIGAIKANVFYQEGLGTFFTFPGNKDHQEAKRIANSLDQVLKQTQPVGLSLGKALGLNFEKPRPIRHQAVDLLRDRNGGLRPSEDNIQAEIVRLSALQFINMSLQPGTTKSENGKTYTLNENHRWTLPDDEGVEFDTQGVLDFAPPPARTGNQGVMDFGEDAEEEAEQQDDDKPEETKSYALQRTPRKFTQLNENGKPYQSSYSPGDKFIDRSQGLARTGQVIGFTEDPDKYENNLLVRYDDKPDLFQYISPGQITSENDFGRGREKGTWEDSLAGMNVVKFRKHGQFQVVGFDARGRMLLRSLEKKRVHKYEKLHEDNADGDLYTYKAYTGFRGSEYVLRRVGDEHNYSNLEGKFTGKDPVAKSLGVSSVQALKWLQENSSVDQTVAESKSKIDGMLNRSLEDFKDYFNDERFQNIYRQLALKFNTLNKDSKLNRRAEELPEKIDVEQMEKTSTRFLSSVKEKFGQRALKLMSAMKSFSIYPTQESLSLFVSQGATASIQGAYRHGSGVGVDNPSGYDVPQPASPFSFLSSDRPELSGQAYLSTDDRSLKDRIKANWPDWPDEIVDSYLKVSYPLEADNADQPGSLEHTWLHEMCHVLDGPHGVFSKSEEWKKIAEKEIVGKSAYSAVMRPKPGAPYELRTEIPMKDVKEGDKVYASAFPHLEEHADKDGFLTITGIKDGGKDWAIAFQQGDHIFRTLVPAKNNFNKKSGLVLERSPEGSPIPISNYARSKPVESWAEFGALLALRPDYAKKNFPKAFRYWQKRGLTK